MEGAGGGAEHCALGGWFVGVLGGGDGLMLVGSLCVL